MKKIIFILIISLLIFSCKKEESDDIIPLQSWTQVNLPAYILYVQDSSSNYTWANATVYSIKSGRTLETHEIKPTLPLKILATSGSEFLIEVESLFGEKKTIKTGVFTDRQTKQGLIKFELN